MIIRDEDTGELKILNGRVYFISGFQSSQKKVRFRQHKQLIEALGKRGYYSNGKRRPSPSNVIDGFLSGLDIKINPDNSVDIFSQLLVEAENLHAELDKTNSPDNELEFYENPDTGQRIPLETLMAATKLWPLDEVLALVP